MAKIHEDQRGKHIKFFSRTVPGFNEVHEIFSTVNNKGTVRGFHWQYGEETTQQKVVKALSGKFNVRVVDFDEKIIYEYDNVDVNSNEIEVLKGQALGYVALEDNSVMLYIADNDFSASHDTGVNPMSFGVDWNVPEKFDFIMSERDFKNEVIHEEFKVIKL